MSYFLLFSLRRIDINLVINFGKNIYTSVQLMIIAFINPSLMINHGLLLMLSDKHHNRLNSHRQISCAGTQLIAVVMAELLDRLDRLQAHCDKHCATIIST